jgi:hypothetical protein
MPQKVLFGFELLPTTIKRTLPEKVRSRPPSFGNCAGGILSVNIAPVIEVTRGHSQRRVYLTAFAKLIRIINLG